MPQKVIGLDLGSYSVKVLTLESTFKKFEVIRFDEYVLSEDEETSYNEKVKEALKSLKDSGLLKYDSLITSVRGEYVSNRSFELPFKDQAKIAQTVSGTIEDLVPFEIDDMIIDYKTIMQKQTPGSTIMSSMVHKEKVQDLLDTLAEISLHPKIVGVDSFSYLNLKSFLKPEKPIEQSEDADQIDYATAIIDMGHTHTTITIYNETNLVYSRTIEFGGDYLTKAIAEKYGCSYKEAEKRKYNCAISQVLKQDDEEIAEDNFDELSENTFKQEVDEEKTEILSELENLSDFIKKEFEYLIKELKLTVISYHFRKKGQITKLYLCGGTSGIKGLDNYISNILDCKVELLNPLKGIESTIEPREETLSKMPMSLALAMNGVGAGRGGWINFRKGEFSFTGGYQYLRSKMVHIGVSLLILLLLGFSSFYSRYLIAESRQEKLDDQLKSFSKKLLGKPHTNYKIVKRIMMEKIKPTSSIIPNMSAFDIFNEISNRVSKSGDIEIREMDITLMKGEMIK